ncbi:hypothetical protein CKO28_01270 [Rhodovibrio sodomensis]|uniref:Uncharacterized protein n=1 Tax=Rhodovibrio sodomensis TaxID=1088 RepID=A0ABS1D8V7_9PROT|nr:hypothetical protein [Rhodovibrio sodomensis]MBK1666674.1 hypothetical protein [Rhodovibrio sodomensis]
MPLDHATSSTLIASPDLIASLDHAPIFPLDPEGLAAAIDIPVSDWPLNCHAVACTVRDLVPVQGMRVMRGHYDGPVHPRSVFSRGLQQHSWLELEDGRILDPTRWTLDRPDAPYIYLGVCDHYDAGGRALAEAVPPPFPGTGPDFSDRIARLAEAERARLAASLETSAGTPEQLWARLRKALRRDPAQLAEPAALYEMARELGLKALIPIDSWQRVMEPEALACNPGSNRFFALPPISVPKPRELLGELLARFVSIEERDLRLEDELAEHGISLDAYHDALNRLIDGPEWPLNLLPLEDQYILGIATTDILGQGFGTTLRVERYARSRGYSRDALDAAMKEVGAAFGIDAGWT